MIVPIKIVIKDEYTIETVALFDKGADLNCIQEGLLPTKYFEKKQKKVLDLQMDLNFK